MDTDQIQFESIGGLDLHPPRKIKIKVVGKNVAYLGAAYAEGQTPVSWMAMAITGGGENYELSIAFGNTVMRPGVHQASFTVGTADAEGKILKTKVVTVKVLIKARLELQSERLTEQRTYGADDGTHQLAIGVTADPQTQWQVSTAESWISLVTSQGQGDGTIKAVVNYADKEPGNYAAFLTVVDKSRPENKATLYYKLELATPQLTLNYTPVLLGGDDGITDNNLPLTFSVNTANKKYPYTLKLQTNDGSNWLQADKPNGLAGTEPQTVLLSSKPAAALSGEYSGKALVEVEVGKLRLSKEIPVQMQREFNRISLSSNGIHLSSAPDQQLLSRKIYVFNSRQQTDIPWQAKSDQSWLKVTATGTTADALTITAIPDGLARNQTHFANVTVSSPDPTVQNTEQIRVGFTPLSQVPGGQRIVLDAQEVTTTIHTAFSPVEPVLYVASQNKISFYDAYNGSLLGQYVTKLNTIDAITLSVDGLHLFIYDSSAKEINMLRTKDGQVLHRFKVHPASDYRVGLLHSRNNGESLLLGNNFHIFDTNTGLEMKLPRSGYAPVGKNLSAPYSPHRVSTGSVFYDVKVSTLNNYQVSTDFAYALPNAAISCQSYDGQFVYGLGGNPAVLTQHHWQLKKIVRQITLPAFGIALQCSVQGNIIAGLSNQQQGQPEILLYNAEGTLLQSFELPYLASLRRLNLSADGTQLMVLSYGAYDDGSVLRLFRLRH